MAETATRTPSHLPEPQAIILFIHSLQLGLALIISCLDVYGVYYLPHNVLVCSLIISCCTVAVCIYFIVSQCCFRRFYSTHIAGAYHVWMLVFWLIDLSLLAYLANSWQTPECTSDLRTHSMSEPYEKRTINARRATPVNTYYGALLAGALLAASELALWVLTTIFIFLHWRKHRFARPLASRQTTSPEAPAALHHGGIPFNDIGEEDYTQIFQVPAPADYWGHPSTPMSSERGPILPDVATTDEETPTDEGEEGSICARTEATVCEQGDPASYPPTGLTFSAEDSARRGGHNVEGTMVVSPSIKSSHAAEESTGLPSDTEQIDWSARSSLQINAMESVSGSVSEGRVRRLTMGDVSVEF